MFSIFDQLMISRVEFVVTYSVQSTVCGPRGCHGNHAQGPVGLGRGEEYELALVHSTVVISVREEKTRLLSAIQITVSS